MKVSTDAVRRMLRLLAVLVVVGVFAAERRAGAQTAPEGNAHPRTQNLTADNSALPSPFGQHNVDLSKLATVAEKAAFAAQVNLEPLRDLAVFHNGRVKVIGTLAKETVNRITGKRRYVDYIKTPKAGGGENVKEASFDPLFTLLDLVIDPAYYLDKPLVGVDYLPLRRAFLEAQFPDDADTQERWMRVTRVTPMMIEKHAQDIAAKHMSEESYSRAMSRVYDGVQLYMEGKSNWEVVAPPNRTDPWQHLSRLPEDAPVRKAAAELGAAWRARDASKVNAAAATLAAELPKINPGTYPAAKRELEVLYNKVNAFEWGYWAYFLSLVTLLLAFGTARKGLAGAGVGLLAVGLTLHAFGFVSRCIIAERFAIQNQFESMTGLSLFAVTVGTVVMLLRRQWLFGAAAAGVGFLVLITATQTGIPGVFIEREAAILNTSVLLKYHVTTVLVSYGLIALGFIISLFYLGVYYFQGSATASLVGVGGGTGISVALGEGFGGTRAKTLADLDTAQMIVLQLAFWTLGVGILLGAWWADHSWGRWWAFDPKETWALITWIVYLIVVHVRIASPQKKGITSAWLSVAGFIVMLWTYFGVNLLLPGLHAYA